MRATHRESHRYRRCGISEYTHPHLGAFLPRQSRRFHPSGAAAACRYGGSVGNEYAAVAFCGGARQSPPGANSRCNAQCGHGKECPVSHCGLRRPAERENGMGTGVLDSGRVGCNGEYTLAGTRYGIRCGVDGYLSVRRALSSRFAPVASARTYHSV